MFNGEACGRSAMLAHHGCAISQRTNARGWINSSQGAFRDLLQAGLFTGCRYGELARLRARDFNTDSGTVFVSESKSGKSRYVVLTAEGQKFLSILCAGRPTGDLMLTRDGGEAWGPSNAIVHMAGTMAAARVTGGSFHSLRHTAASHMVMAGVPAKRGRTQSWP